MFGVGRSGDLIDDLAGVVQAPELG